MRRLHSRASVAKAMVIMAFSAPYESASDDSEGRSLMSSKRQTTMAKLTRERKVKEKRELKREKKLAAAAAKLAESEAPTDSVDPENAEEPDAADVETREE
jgi:hypothetical protein